MARLCRQVRQWICIIIQKPVRGRVPGAPSMNFSIVDIVKIDGENITVKSDAIAETVVSAQGRSFAIGHKATLGLRPQQLDC